MKDQPLLASDAGPCQSTSLVGQLQGWSGAAAADATGTQYSVKHGSQYVLCDV